MFPRLYSPTCVFIQREQTGHVARKDVIGDLSKPARISVGSNNAEDFCARLCVAADAHSILFRVEDWAVIIQVFYFNVHVGLSAEASLRKNQISETKS